MFTSKTFFERGINRLSNKPKFKTFGFVIVQLLLSIRKKVSAKCDILPKSGVPPYDT